MTEVRPGFNFFQAKADSSSCVVTTYISQTSSILKSHIFLHNPSKYCYVICMNKLIVFYIGFYRQSFCVTNGDIKHPAIPTLLTKHLRVQTSTCLGTCVRAQIQRLYECTDTNVYIETKAFCVYLIMPLQILKLYACMDTCTDVCTDNEALNVQIREYSSCLGIENSIINDYSSQRKQFQK